MFPGRKKSKANIKIASPILCLRIDQSKQTKKKAKKKKKKKKSKKKKKAPPQKKTKEKKANTGKPKNNHSTCRVGTIMPSNCYRYLRQISDNAHCRNQAVMVFSF